METELEDHNLRFRTFITMARGTRCVKLDVAFGFEVNLEAGDVRVIRQEGRFAAGAAVPVSPK